MKRIWTLSASERSKMLGAQQRGVHLSNHRARRSAARPLDQRLSRPLAGGRHAGRLRACEKPSPESSPDWPLLPPERRPTAGRVAMRQASAKSWETKSNVGVLWIFVVALVVVALVLVFAGVKMVAQGTNWTIERSAATRAPRRACISSCCSWTGSSQDQHAGIGTRHSAAAGDHQGQCDRQRRRGRVLSGH